MSDEMFSRDEVLGGALSRVRRARACLYLIEQEATRQVDRRWRVLAAATAAPEIGAAGMEFILGDDETMRRPLPGEADEAFIESFRNARRQASSTTARLIDRTVATWQVLIPTDLALRAEVLHQMSIRHDMPTNATHKLAAAFGVGTADFDTAYEAVTGSPVGSAFSARPRRFGLFRLPGR